MMNKLDISDTCEILKVGDTVANIEEGKNTKVFTAAILSGTQSEEILLQAESDFILRSLFDLKQIVYIKICFDS